jgi:hypothetical protein
VTNKGIVLGSQQLQNAEYARRARRVYGEFALHL